MFFYMALKEFWSCDMLDIAVDHTGGSAIRRKPRKDRVKKSLPSGRSVLGDEISADRLERPEAYALAKELAAAVSLKRCLANLIEPERHSFKLDGDEVACFSNSFCHDIYEMSFQYERVSELAQVEELLTATNDADWPTDKWVRNAFEDPGQILLSVRARGARRPQGFISYRRETVVESFDESQLRFYYELTIEYIFVSKRMRGKSLGSALIAPLVMDGERDVRYLAKRLNAERFRSLNFTSQITIAAEVYSPGAEYLCNQVFEIISDTGREAFDSFSNNRFDLDHLFVNEVCD
jgi:GNAT superfamily N-acetyltransferase